MTPLIQSKEKERTDPDSKWTSLEPLFDMLDYSKHQPFSISDHITILKKKNGFTINPKKPEKSINTAKPV
jgi:hypothetical protein